MDTEAHEKRETRKTRKRSPRQKRNPIETAINIWYEKHAVHLTNRHSVGDFIAQAPKRWTAYGSLVLLPAGSFTSATWREVLNSAAVASPLNSAQHEESIEEDGDEGPALLWKTILAEISGLGATKLTHLAVNESIPLHSSKDGGRSGATKPGAGAGAGEGENILRSPSGLRMLYGDFGPGGEEKEGEEGEFAEPTEDDFARAFWVSTKQNGITQTWAPRWTMFSRGNVKEKARLLRFHDPPSGKLGLKSPNQDPTQTQNENEDGNQNRSESEDLAHRHIPPKDRAGAVAVDLYAGIGYFAFSYAATGFRKVFCWELNPWSVEGLRRGAGANGWSVRVVVPPPPPPPPPHHTENRREEEEETILLKDILVGDETIVVFLEDNARAADRLRRLDGLELEREREREGEKRKNGGDEEDTHGFRMSSIMHINLGLLPTSRLSWATAWEIARGSRLAWFHVHENVGVADIDAKKGEIREWFAERARALDGRRGGGGVEDEDEDEVRTDVCVEHVELVKTFAPGVWHCVFDLCVRQDVN
ncbi:S-adenosyl-L-methionine-dependent methyltransferase [Xylaria acuta]|nr:S-adenosyl-L-methionine-dependent methyltransferase [Xylaria acuta]